MSSKKAIRTLAGYLAGAVLLWGSCTDDIQPGTDGSEEATRIFVNISVQQPGTRTASTRGALDPDEGEYELGITEAEHQINTLTLVMMQVDANGTETFEASQTLSVSETDKNESSYKLTFDLTGRTGTKRFYVGANLQQAHIGAFGTQDRVFNAGEGTTGHNIVGSLMTISHEPDGNGEGSNIVMTGIVTNNKGERDITLSNNPTGNEIQLQIKNPVTLTRTVAKVLLTCQPKEGAETYVNVVDIKDKDQSTADNTGWIQFANVNYMLNVLNRKTYLDYREEGNGTDTYLTDPNYKISDLIEDRGDEGGYGLKDLNAYRQEFLYYDTQQMVEMLNGDVQSLEDIETEPCTTRKATVYDESKVDKNKPEAHYTEGLYCPENMVYNDLPGISTENLASVNRFVSTRIMVGAKYTPKKIYTDENGKPTVKTASTEYEAKKLLDEANGEGYLSGTFWQDNMTKQYYTLSGMKKKLEEDSDTEFNRYDGGWGYYYTYVDQEANDVTDGDDTTITRWGVKRNHYYIIKVDKIIAPGSAFPGNEVMRIHSELVNWKEKGSSDIDIDLPQ